jgi:hypothetical protein
MQRFSLAVTHGTAIIITKLWVRVVHYISRFFRNSLKKIEARLMKLEKKNEGNPGGQSVFLTTIKTYKHEVKKLQGRVEEELPRPREEVANLENSDNIDESKPE